MFTLIKSLLSTNLLCENSNRAVRRIRYYQQHFGPFKDRYIQLLLGICTIQYLRVTNVSYCAVGASARMQARLYTAVPDTYAASAPL